MCGRFGLTRPERLDLERFGVASVPATRPRYNITPGTEVLVVRERSGERRAEFLHWGLIPSWAPDPSIGNRTANARADSAFEKPAFRNAMRLRRCLIPADVFYEWQEAPGRRRKQPYAVRLRDGEPFALAGLWDYWRPRDAARGTEGIASCTVLTTEPNTLLAPIHDRMPVIIPPSRYSAWIDARTPGAAVQDLLRSYPSDEMEAWAISTRVNDPALDDATVLEPVAPG
jgi:putative SOS response-associated peptidase YedK